MSHPQNSQRGAFAKDRIEVGAAGVVTGDSTGNLSLNAGLALSGQPASNVITQNSTAVIFPDGIKVGKVSAVLSGRKGPGTIVMVGNSTGNMLAVNTTGTTWSYLNVTSVLA